MRGKRAASYASAISTSIVLLSLTLVGLNAVTFPSSLEAHEGATGVVKDRMHTMMSNGDSVVALRDMLLGQIAFNAEQIKIHARSIADGAGEAFTTLFPEGSLDNPTEALPAIWEDWETFSALADELQVRAQALEASVDGAAEPAEMEAAFADAFQTLGEICNSCHTKFRMEKQD